MTRHLPLASLDHCTFVSAEGPDAENSFSIFGKASDGEPSAISTTITVAAQLASRIEEALRQIAKEGRPVSAPRSPEGLVRYNAAPDPHAPGDVVLLIEGDRSDPLLVRLPTDAARTLGSLLTDSAQSSTRRLPRH